MKKSERGERVKWRAHFNQLIARPIPREAFPGIVSRMKDDDLCCILHIEGYTWYSGRYVVALKAVRDIWGLSVYQWKRFIQYIIEEDPFMEEDDDEV